MKPECRNCRSSKGLTDKQANLSLKAQEEMKTAQQAVLGQGKEVRLKAIEGVVTSPAYKDLIQAHGGFSISKKPTDVDGTYIVCSNEENLKAEKATKTGIVYKYYHSCPFFEAKEE